MTTSSGMNERTNERKATYTVFITFTFNSPFSSSMAAIPMMEGGMTVVDAMVACGLDHVHLFMDQTQAERFANDVFDDLFTSCLDITFKELDEHFKTYGELTVAQGQIRVRPGSRKNIKAFVQWTRDELRLGRDPSLTPFPIDIVSDCIRRYKTHEKFLTDSKTLSGPQSPRSLKSRRSGRIGSPHSSTTFVALLDVMAFPSSTSVERRMNLTMA
jgi:hypothetical protein